MKKTITYKNDDDTKCYYEQAIDELINKHCVSVKDVLQKKIPWWTMAEIETPLYDKRFKQHKLAFTKLLILRGVDKEEIKSMNRAQMMAYLYLFDKG